MICAISLSALARIKSRLSGFGRIWHILAVFSVFGLGAAWIGQLLFGGRPPFRPTLLTVLVLAALPAADGMAALLIDRLKQRLVRTGEASRRIYAPAADLEDEELADELIAPDAIGAQPVSQSWWLGGESRIASQWIVGAHNASKNGTQS